jgi:hypothetical protein
MYPTKKGEQQRFKREELKLRKETIFFTFEIILLCVVTGLSIWVLLGNYRMLLKAICGGWLGYIARSIIRHLTNRLE